MRSLRAENIKLTGDVTRLTEKCTEAQRKADLATAAETTLKTQLRSAEANAKALRDDVARMKSLVAQIRASCATETRRRDRQIDALKKQLGEAGRLRGSRGNPAVTTITVTGVASDGRDTRNDHHGSDAELRGESNAMFAEMARHLTEENDSMLSMMQQIMRQLKEMSGWSGGEREDAHVQKRPTCEDLAADRDSVMTHMRNILTNPSFVPIEEVVVREEEIDRLRLGWLRMESRWKDAVHLMDGWRKRMATSGKPVCDAELRMGMRLSPVRVHDVEETCGAGQNPLSVVKEESEEHAGLDFRSPCPGGRHDVAYEYADREDVSESDATDHDEDVANIDAVMQGTQDSLNNSCDTEESRSHPEERRRPSPLRNSNSASNRGFLQNDKPKARSNQGATPVKGTVQKGVAPVSKSMKSFPVRPKSLTAQTRLPSTVQRPMERPRSPSRTSLDEALLPKREAEVKSERAREPQTQQVSSSKDGTQQQEQVSSKSRAEELVQDEPDPVPDTMEPPRNGNPASRRKSLDASNIAAKLAATEKNADAARVRAKIRATRSSTRGVSRPVLTTAAGTDAAIRGAVGGAAAASAAKVTTSAETEPPAESAKQEDGQLDGSVPKMEKRKRDRKISKTASRRRSTLSPQELQTLMLGSVQ